MNEKNEIKISLSTLFIIIAIIVILIMAYFIYNINTEKINLLTESKNLNEKVANLEEKIINQETENSNENLNVSQNTEQETKANNTDKITFSFLKGLYKGNVDTTVYGETPDNITDVSIYLFENGSYVYCNMPGLSFFDEEGKRGGPCNIGYYTFENNQIILHNILECGNGVDGMITPNKTYTLKINEDYSLTDTELTKTTLKKSSETIDEYDAICYEIQMILSGGALTTAEN